MTRTNTLAALTLAGALLCAGAAQAQDSEPARITEVHQSDGAGPSVLVNLGSASGVRPGQTLEVRRDDKTIGYGSVDRVFSSLAVATVGTLVSGVAPLKAGDQVVFLDSGFEQPPGQPARETPAPAGDEEEDGPRPAGRVISVRGGVVLVDFGRDSGLEVGHVVALYDASSVEVGRIAIELVGGSTAGGLVVTGDAKMGLSATSLGMQKDREGPIDFVALDFLGVIADLEHATPHRAPCHIGVPVRRILPGSPAQRGGIGRGDRLVAVDGIVVRDIASVRKRIEAREGKSVRVSLVRGDRVVHVDIDFSK